MNTTKPDDITPEFLMKMIVLYSIIILAFANKNDFMADVFKPSQSKTITATHLNGMLAE